MSRKTKGVWIRYRDIRKHFDSVKEAAEFIGAAPKSLYDVLSNQKMSVYGWSVWYDDSEEERWIRDSKKGVSDGNAEH